MNFQYTKKNGHGGISKQNRELLDRLHQERRAPFTPEEIVSAWHMEPIRVRRLLAHWASRGWLSRLRRGLYVTVPLGTRHPGELSEDPWMIAHRLFAPCYIGGWSACEHWGLTEQIFRGVVVFTTRKVHHRTPTIKETPYIIKTISENKFFGTAGIWRRDTKVQVSIPARTIADLLNDPAIGGGIRHVAEIVERFFTGEHRDETGLLEAVARLNNRTIYKRLGYIIEIFTLDAPEALRLCHERLSAGYSTLDPTVEAQGSLMRRWMLRINVRLKSEEPTP